MARSLKSALESLRRGQALSLPLAQRAFGECFGEQATPEELGALLMGLAQKGETSDELAGAALGWMQGRTSLPALPGVVMERASGSGRALQPIVVATGIALASLGCAVQLPFDPLCALGGCQAELLRVLGLAPSEGAAGARTELDRGEISWISRQALPFGPPQRDRLGFSSLAHLLGILTHPFASARRWVGLADPTRSEALARALGTLGAQRALVVHGFLQDSGRGEGIDGVSLSGPTRCAHWRAGTLSCFELRPEELGLGRHPLASLLGGEAQENARSLRDLFAGAHNAYRDAVIYSGALALWVASEDDRPALRLHADRVRQALDSGQAATRLEALIRHANSSL